MFSRRSMVAFVLLLLFTCGIFPMYFIVATQNEIKLNYRRSNLTSGGMTLFLMFITCGIYYIFWVYQSVSALNDIANERGRTVGDDALLITILGIFIPIVSYLVIQDKINNIVDYSNFNNREPQTF